MIEAYRPAPEDMWFRQSLLADEETMAYNAAWGGTIAFPREAWAKWYARWLVSEAVVKVLEDCDPQFPTLSDEERAKMAECRERLINWPSE